MPQSKQTILNFYCGVCTKQLTDETALFTSCGHFFCSNPEAKCTRMRPIQGAGRCEQCGKECDAGNLANRGSRYNSRLQSYVFSDLKNDLKVIADIIQFRNTHLQILGENAAAQQQRITTLTARCNSQMEENKDLQQENKELRLELSRLRQMKLSKGNLGGPTATRAYERNGSDGIAVVELDSPPRHSIQQMNKRRGTPHESIRTNRVAEPSTMNRALTERTYERSLRTRSIRKNRESQPIPSRPPEMHGGVRKDDRSTTLKRRWADRTGTEGVYGRSKVGRKEIAPRFGNTAGESRGAVRGSYKPQQSFSGDWQRKVSSVPRPSATPDKLRRRVRRSVIDMNPLGKRY